MLPPTRDSRSLGMRSAGVSTLEDYKAVVLAATEEMLLSDEWWDALDAVPTDVDDLLFDLPGDRVA